VKMHIGQPEREVLVLMYDYYDFENPPYMASRQRLIARIAVGGTSLSHQPCQAWHGYMLTNAHREEVEVGDDGHASPPPPGPPPQRRRRAPLLLSLKLLKPFLLPSIENIHATILPLTSTTRTHLIHTCEYMLHTTGIYHSPPFNTHPSSTHPLTHTLQVPPLPFDLAQE
jgi:hypothetical protein